MTGSSINEYDDLEVPRCAVGPATCMVVGSDGFVLIAPATAAGDLQEAHDLMVCAHILSCEL